MSTGTTSNIVAGRAAVQAYLDENPLNQGLARLQTKLKLWQAGLSRTWAGAYGGELPAPFGAIARFAASPAGAFSALLGAAKLTADAREEMFRMSETTGVAVEKLSALAYAARRAGVSNEALASGLRKMQGKEFQAMLSGPKAGQMQGIVAGLGLDKTADAADQFRQIVAQFEKLDSVSRVGRAKNLGISELLPLINQGVDGLDAFTQRAKDLGLVMSEHDAKAGKQFGLAIGDLHDVVMSNVSAIGGALVPVITGLTNMVVKISVGIRDWIKDHEHLTQIIFFGTGLIVGAGLALKALSIALGIAKIAVGGVTIIFGIASGVVTAFNFVLGITETLLGSMAAPFLLLGAGIVAIVAYLAKLSGAFSGFGDAWKALSNDTSNSMDSIAHAIEAGNLRAAWDVVTAYVRTEWYRLLDTMLTAYGDFVGGIREGLKKMVTQPFELVPDAAKYLMNTERKFFGFAPEGGAGGAGEEGPGLADRLQTKLQQARADLMEAQRKAMDLEVPDARKNKNLFDAAQGTEVRSTFSGVAAALMGGGSGIAGQQLQAQTRSQGRRRENGRQR